jgi:exodeoxyribonuclease VII small subunit
LVSDPSATPVQELSFDQALEQLEAAARQLESGDVPLEQALTVYERAVALFRHCNRRLQDVEQRLELLTRDLDGQPAATALDPESEASEDE